ncbi:MAG: tRNA (N(6)-L-threonylcarbamoyladenosine(37)-C(2))-methylthiotransferase MtaB [Clostridiales bacterium]|nr:tRNA (N(6)-L-threonylcarbamoyladenosine(37)-C(2))-methylthiotransferase MtaB [Clostridiales bacterium]MCF8021452.1 tRNA (N(6)-L-threonylcarbamoyladenosine(37)-C(2))-methylthiotransferase MtaB [Clostridiales bacterium]
MAITTLGCKVNQYESYTIENLFLKNGYEIVDFSDSANIYIINTCTVTHIGDRKSRQLIRKAVRNNPDAFIVVTGCYAQLSPGEILKIPGVDMVIGTSDRSNIVELVENNSNKDKPVNAVTDIMKTTNFEELPSALEQKRIRGFLKIQEGCSNFCAYCIIPYTRGPLRSRSPVNVIKEAERLIDHGYKEIVLTGIHIGAYGKDLKGKKESLAGIINQICSLEGLKRLRISSLEPQDVDYDLIDILASSSMVCRHFHLPLQSGDDYILKNMRRRYDTQHYKDIVYRIKQKMPSAAVTTDIITGFPGETDERFTNTLDFIKQMEFADLHVFKYSPRAGTAAASFAGQVASREKEKRKKMLLETGEKLRYKFLSNYLGEEMTVLVEQFVEQNNLFEGVTDNYIKIMFFSESVQRGDFINVMAEKVINNHLYGRIV